MRALLALLALLAAAGAASALAPPGLPGVGIEASVEADVEAGVARPAIAAPNPDALRVPLSAPNLDGLDASAILADALTRAARPEAGDGEIAPRPVAGAFAEVQSAIAAAVAASGPAPPSAAAGLAGSAILAKIFGAFYSRIPASRVLDHPTRRALMDLVRAEPGIPMQDVQSRLGLGWGTTVYHVERLQSDGVLVSEHGHGRRLYAAGAMPAAERARRAVLAGETTARIAGLVHERPGVAQKELCQALGVAPSVASKHLAKLRAAGLVTEAREWRTVRYFPASLAAPRAPSAPGAALA